jgi:hypothetical protein
MKTEYYKYFLLHLYEALMYKNVTRKRISERHSTHRRHWYRASCRDNMVLFFLPRCSHYSQSLHRLLSTARVKRTVTISALERVESTESFPMLSRNLLK